MAAPKKSEVYDEDLNPNLNEKKRGVADISGSGSFVSNNPMNFFQMRVQEFKQKRAKEKELSMAEKEAEKKAYLEESEVQAQLSGERKGKEKAMKRFDPENKPLRKIAKGFGVIGGKIGGKIVSKATASPKRPQPSQGVENPFANIGKPQIPERHGPAQSEFNVQQREPKGRFIDLPIGEHEGGTSSLLESSFFGDGKRRGASALERHAGGNISDEFGKTGGVFGAMSDAVHGRSKGGNPLSDGNDSGVFGGFAGAMLKGGKKRKGDLMGGSGQGEFSGFASAMMNGKKGKSKDLFGGFGQGILGGKPRSARHRKH